MLVFFPWFFFFYWIFEFFQWHMIQCHCTVKIYVHFYTRVTLCHKKFWTVTKFMQIITFNLQKYKKCTVLHNNLQPRDYQILGGKKKVGIFVKQLFAPFIFPNKKNFCYFFLFIFSKSVKIFWTFGNGLIQIYQPWPSPLNQ